MPAIRLENSRGVTLRDVRISGFDVGISAHNSEFTANRLAFDNVVRPFDISGDGYARVEGTRITNDPKLGTEVTRKTTVGWTRNGPPLPAQCPNCKAVFPSRNYDIATPRFFSRDNEESCPECKKYGAKVADGLFDLTSDAVKILEAPDITYAMVAALARIAEDVSANRITPQQAVEKLAYVDPRIGSIAKKVVGFGGSAIEFLTFAIGLAALIYTHIGTTATLEARDLAREQT
ncbi:hypothetical protein [Methylobacterium sp. WSM2598]|uniref:hypothetical protein n=1 Tax=Methylobacterium sp. WSM2598 TaxID=398261 RepID=UPI0012F6A848|nr:hypothetical protein [Methylobacterium sp. WSM2598]